MNGSNAPTFIKGQFYRPFRWTCCVMLCHMKPKNERHPIDGMDELHKPDLASQIARLADEFQLADIYAFGSRAKEIALRLGTETRPDPENRSSSDVDIGIRPLSGAKLRSEEIVRLTLRLEDIFDPHRVDLVLIPASDPLVSLDVIRGELLYARDPVDQARYELFVLRRAGDLAPLKKERMKIVLEGHGR